MSMAWVSGSGLAATQGACVEPAGESCHPARPRLRRVAIHPTAAVTIGTACSRARRDNRRLQLRRFRTVPVPAPCTHAHPEQLHFLDRAAPQARPQRALRRHRRLAAGAHLLRRPDLRTGRGGDARLRRRRLGARRGPARAADQLRRPGVPRRAGNPRAAAAPGPQRVPGAGPGAPGRPGGRRAAGRVQRRQGLGPATASATTPGAAPRGRCAARAAARGPQARRSSCSISTCAGPKARRPSAAATAGTP